MKIIQSLSEMIEEEVRDAEKYATCALRHKEENPALAETFYKLANEEIGHANALHAQVVTIINNYKKEHGDPPEVMAKLYNILHERNMKNMATVKGMLSLYK